MKTLLVLMVFIIPLLSSGQSVNDTIIINDLWQKPDSLKNNAALQKSMDSSNEMQLTTPQKKKNNQVRIYGNQNSESQNTYYSNTELEIIGQNRFKRRRNRDIKYSHSFSGHWCGFYFGFVNFAQADYSMYPPETGKFMDLDYSNSFTMQFNVLEQSINLVPGRNFGFVVGLGLEYQRFRFDKNYQSIQVDDGIVQPRALNSEWNVKKNSFKTLYLTIPVMLEYQLPGNSMYISGGVMGGVRLLSRTKVVYRDEENHKKKNRSTDDFNLFPFKADAIAKIGYGHVNVWGSYTFTRMFKKDKGPELNPYAIGLGISF